MEDFAVWFKRELSRRHWSLPDFAERADVSLRTVNSWFNGTRTPSTQMCQKIASGLGEDPDLVLEKAGHIPPDKHDDIDISTRRVRAAALNVDWTRDRESAVMALLTLWQKRKH